MFVQSIGLLGTMLAISNSEPKTSFSRSAAETKTRACGVAEFSSHIAGNGLNECGDDLVPTEGWGDRSQNCLHDVRIVGNT